MSKLNFSAINEAFLLGSDQIKNTQEEIAKLKQLIGNSELGIKPPPPQETAPPYQRIGPPDKVSATFTEPSPGNFDQTYMNLIKHPRFDDIVHKYVSENHPNWLLSSTNFTPKGNHYGYVKENFGNKYATTICSDIKNYILFFIISLIIYMFLSLLVKR